MLIPFILLQQEIEEASNNVARKYYNTLETKRTGLEVATMMRAVAKAKQQSFKGQFSKFTVVANPKLGDEFLEEVSVFCLHPSQFLL